ncbi:hypothetical protein SAY86_027849 [Trapa natans]|uniref:ER membrane protein complex subunit 10 n=1 Tax=Trapa natans TaxID=22666 RepID=A0AAN7LTS5_TRANT|nr:hypothetical protein SAY86_027849 [Trapa natans]
MSRAAMEKPLKKKLMLILGLAVVLVGLGLSTAFQSDELLLEDEFGLEGSAADVTYARPSQPAPTRKRSSDPDSDSKIQFSLEHAFGESEFFPAGTFTGRLKTWSHGSQTLTKLRFSRNSLTDTEREQFQKLLQGDDFYRIRLPSNILSPPGKDYIVSSVKARCLPHDGLDEHFVIHMEGVNILAVNYGAPGACPYPRQLKLPSKWAFNSYTILKNAEQAQRTPVFTEEITVEDDGEIRVTPPEKSFWAKYWMYLIPLGLIVMNAMTQAMNMPEEQAASQGQQGGTAAQRAPVPAVRRR